MSCFFFNILSIWQTAETICDYPSLQNCTLYNHQEDKSTILSNCIIIINQLKVRTTFDNGWLLSNSSIHTSICWFSVIICVFEFVFVLILVFVWDCVFEFVFEFVFVLIWILVWTGLMFRNNCDILCDVPKRLCVDILCDVLCDVPKRLCVDILCDALCDVPKQLCVDILCDVPKQLYVLLLHVHKRHCLLLPMTNGTDVKINLINYQPLSPVVR